MSIRAAWAAGLALAAVLPVAAAPPSGGGSPPGGSTEIPPLRRDASGDPGTAQRAPGAALQLTGRVVDESGRPVGGVAVKAFLLGVLSGSTKTAPDGTFSLAASPAQGAKGSAVVWFQAPDAETYLDASVVLWAGDVAKEAGLFPPCTRIVAGTLGQQNVEVTLRSVDERKKAVVESNCLEDATTPRSPR